MPAPRILSTLVWAGSVLAFASGLQAVTFTVSNTADSGSGSLRQAIIDANTTPGADVIEFAPALSLQTINVGSVMSITGSVTIEGPDEKITLDGGSATRILESNHGLVSAVFINRVVFKDGAVSDLSGGGAVFINTQTGGDITYRFTDCEFTGNEVTGVSGGGAVSAACRESSVSLGAYSAITNAKPMGERSDTEALPPPRTNFGLMTAHSRTTTRQHPSSRVVVRSFSGLPLKL